MDKFESSIEEIGEIVTDGERRERERERGRPRVSYADAEMMHRGPS